MNPNHDHDGSTTGHYNAKYWPLGVTIEGELLKCCRSRGYFTKKPNYLTQSTRYFKLSEVEQRLCWSKKLNCARPSKSLDLRRARLTLMQGGEEGDLITIQPSPLSNSPPVSISAVDGETLLKWYSHIIAAIEGIHANPPEDFSVQGNEHPEMPSDGSKIESNVVEHEIDNAVPPPPPLPNGSEIPALRDERTDSDEDSALGHESASSSVLACFGVSETLWTLPVPRLNPLQQENDEWTDSPGGTRTRFRVVKT